MTDFCVQILRRVASDLAIFIDGRDIPEDTLDSFIVSLEFIYRELVVLEATNTHLTNSQHEATAIVRSCLSTFKSIYELRRLSESFHYQVQPVHTGLVGRPSFTVSPEQLSFLIENQFSAPQIADMVGVSVRTIRRRMTNFGLSISAQYSTVTDSELHVDEIVCEIQTQFPMCGNRQMHGHLLSRGYRVQQSRVRESQRGVDPHGTIIRRLHAVNRREYSVPSPRSLYHIDGYHKLIRYITVYV